jgi:hypothetical protein
MRWFFVAQKRRILSFQTNKIHFQMKKFLLFQAFFCLCVQIWAQTPDKFNYQAVAKNANGTPVTGAIDVQLTILTGSTSGTEAYKELFNSVNVDANGLFSLQIGSGATQGGSNWNNVNWGNGSKFLKAEIKTSIGGGFIQMGDPQQLISVPYAQEAKSLDLPFSKSVSSAAHGFHVTNETESGISGQSNKPGSAGIIGFHSGDGNGVYGRAEGTNGTSITAEHKNGSQALLGTASHAGIFRGNVRIENVGNGANSFQINSDPGNLGMELRGSNPFIDFSNTNADFDARIIWAPNDNKSLVFTQANNYWFQSGPILADGVSPNADAFFRAFNFTGAVNCNPCNTNFSIKAASAVRGAEFQAMSDTRIKNIIAQSNAPADLTTLMRLKVTDYTHKDVVNKGTAAKKGFIAQEVETEFAEAVSKSKDFIPNIYQMAQSSTFDAAAKTLTVTLEKVPDLAVGDRVRIIADKSHEVEVTAVNGTSFTVKNWENVDSKNIFVFGKEVDDFRTVDYDRIFTLNVSATQELARKVTTLEAQNALLTQQNSTYQEKFQQLESKLNALSAQLNGSENKGIGSSNK